MDNAGAALELAYSIPDGMPPPAMAPAAWPTRSLIGAAVRAGKVAGLPRLMPWQEFALTHTTALDDDGRWVYPEVAWTIARQNGKTTGLGRRVIVGLLRGERIGHGAHNRSLPRDTFLEVAGLFRSRPILRQYLEDRPRMTNGEELIATTTGGRYRIFSTKTDAVRGWPHDTILLDEAREQRDTDWIGAATGSLAASDNPQTIYTSNAGDAGSVVLNAVRNRALAADPTLAYLEWSAPGHLPSSDREAWRLSNPALGHTVTMRTLEALYHRADAAGEPATFETEHLCRWVSSMAPRLVASELWDATRGQVEDVPSSKPVFGIAVDPNLRRAAAVAAWRQDDGRIALVPVADVEGDPLDLTELAGELLRRAGGRPRVTDYYLDPWTDGELDRLLEARLTRRPVAGAATVTASMSFVRYVGTPGAVVHTDPTGRLASDMEWLERKPATRDTFTAVTSSDRPAPLALAAVRALYGATTPPGPKPSIPSL